MTTPARPTTPLFAILVSVALGCGGTSGLKLDGDVSGSSTIGAAGADGKAPADDPQAETHDVASSCADATILGDAATYQASSRLACGGEVAVAGLTPFGPFAPKNVRSQVGSGDCTGIWIFFEDQDNDAGERTGQALQIIVPYDTSHRELIGTFYVVGFLTSGTGALLQVRVKVDISAADAPVFDGGAPTSVSGQIAGRIDADTGCGHLTGSFTTPYCFWDQCI